MSVEYRAERNYKIERQIENLLLTAPNYVREFYQSMYNGKRELTTQLSYVRDVILFIQYLQFSIKEFSELELKQIPVSVFDKLKIQDLNEYRAYLKKEKEISNAFAKKQFSAISAFYKFLNAVGHTNNNPMVNFEFPATNKKRIIKLDSELSNKLLNGILANNQCLRVDGENVQIEAIDEVTRLKRERLVLRNYAICCLFLGSGLRVSELVGLDLDDINFRQNSLTIIAKGGDETTVFFGNDVAEGLKNYLNGLPLPQEIIKKYENTEYKELTKWCQQHCADENFIKKLGELYPNTDESFKRDALMLRNSMLRQGRSSLNPKKNHNAVFITTRGTRMSVRSVELMVKEMVQTYLPEYDDKDKFSPHKLRATCATRILTQTGDIQLASTQLNHKGVAVTASFYAELQKEQQKEKIKGLDMNKW